MYVIDVPLLRRAIHLRPKTNTKLIVDRVRRQNVDGGCELRLIHAVGNQSIQFHPLAIDAPVFNNQVAAGVHAAMFRSISKGRYRCTAQQHKVGADVVVLVFSRTGCIEIQ